MKSFVAKLGGWAILTAATLFGTTLPAMAQTLPPTPPPDTYFNFTPSTTDPTFANIYEMLSCTPGASCITVDLRPFFIMARPAIGPSRYYYEVCPSDSFSWKTCKRYDCYEDWDFQQSICNYIGEFTVGCKYEECTVPKVP